MSSVAEIIIRLVDQAAGPGKRIAESLKGVGDAAKKLATELKISSEQAEKLQARLNAVEAAGRRIGTGMRRIASGSIQAGMIGLTYQATKYGLAMGFVRKQLLDTQVEFENYFATLESMSGSKQKAQSLMDWASNFAVITPYELPQVVEALAKLSAYGVINAKKIYEVQGKARIERTMGALGDASSALSKPYMQGVEAIADAMTGQFERLKEAYGIMGSKKGDKVTLEWLDLAEDKTKSITLDLKNREKIVYEIVKILEKNYGGGMLKKSQTTGGMLSNYADAWTRFKQMILRSGLGDEINRQLKSGLDWVDEMSKTYRVKGPDNMWETHSKLSDLAAQFSGVLQNRLRETIELIRDLYTTLRRILDLADQFANSPLGQAIGGWNGMIKGALAIPFVKPLMDIAGGVWDIAAGFASAAFNGWMFYKLLKAIRTVAPAGAAASGAATAVAETAAGAAAGGGIFAALKARAGGFLARSAAAAPQVAALAFIAGLAWGTSKLIEEGRKNWMPKDEEAANDLRARIAELQAKVDQIRSRSKVPEMADTLAAPYESEINDLKGRLKVYEDQAAKTGKAMKQSLDITATPNIDTAMMDSAIAKAQQFRDYMRQIGPIAPTGGAAPAAPAAAPQINVTVHGGGRGDGEALGRKVAAAVREALDRTYGDGANRPTMVG